MDGLWKTVLFALIFAIILGMAVLIIHPQKDIQIIITPGLENPENQFSIFGAVKSPGKYPYKGEIRIEDAVEIAGGFEENADLPHSNIAKWVNDGEMIIIPTLGAEYPTLTPVNTDETRINLNTAGKAELMTLPGIGEKRAGDIIELREKLGGFQSKEDILQISGISEKLLESIYDRIFVK